jgi:hypothetical protein
MGLLDKLKALLSGRKDEVKSGIDKTSDVVEEKVGPEHADKVEGAAEKAKDVVDDLAADAGGSATDAASDAADAAPEPDGGTPPAP